MLIRYAQAVGSLEDGVMELLAQRFGLSDGEPLFEGLQARGVFQADLVMVLLSAGTPAARSAAEVLVGRPVTVGRPALSGPSVLEELEGLAAPPGPDDRVIVAVVRNPRLPTTPSFQRFRQFRVGRTVSQLLARGVTRRDLREALQHGWVTLGEGKR